jgi:hypothetical protein
VLASSAGSAGVLAGIVQTPGLSQLFGCTAGPGGWAIAGSATAGATAIPRCYRCCLGRRCPGCHQLTFTLRSPSRQLNIPSSPSPVRNLAAVEELLVDVLAASLAYLLELLVVRLIRQILPAQ